MTQGLSLHCWRYTRLRRGHVTVTRGFAGQSGVHKGAPRHSVPRRSGGIPLWCCLFGVPHLAFTYAECEVWVCRAS